MTTYTVRVLTHLNRVHVIEAETAEQAAALAEDIEEAAHPDAAMVEAIEVIEAS